MIPEVAGSGEWTEAAVAQARVVARLRERGHRLEQIRKAATEGRLAYGYIETIFPDEQSVRTLEDAAAETDLEPALIERFWASLGLPPSAVETLTSEDLEALRYVA